MIINTQQIIGNAKNSIGDLLDKISSIDLKPFGEIIVFNSSEFNNIEAFRKSISKIKKPQHPIVYIIKIINPTKRQELLKLFDRFHNNEKICFSRRNRNITDNDILYVGSSTTDFNMRIRNHFGLQSPSVYSLHLSRWDNKLDYDISLHLYEVISKSSNGRVERPIVEIIEQQIWDTLNPLFGKKSGL